LTLASGYPTDSHSPFGVGYESKTAWKMIDSCGNTDGELDVSEVFGAFITDYTGQNWPQPFESSYNTGQTGSLVIDNLIATQEGTYVPSPEYPQTPTLGATTAVAFLLRSVTIRGYFTSGARPLAQDC
jgi:hypothetical protein